MEFEGRIQRVLPVRSGTSERGEWKALPFVFEYFESADQRWSDRVLLNTMDPHIMGQIGQFVVRDPQTKKGIEENGQMKLKGEIKCRVGFSHSTREYQGRLYNQVQCYKFELIDAAENTQPATQPAQPVTAAHKDDLPF